MTTLADAPRAWSIAVFGVVFAVFVAREFEAARPARRPAAPVVAHRSRRRRRDAPAASIDALQRCRARTSASTFEKQLTYADGTSKLRASPSSPTSATATAPSRSPARKDSVGKDDDDDRARRRRAAGRVGRHDRARPSTPPMPTATPSSARRARSSSRAAACSATGIGMTWDKNADVLTILDQAVVHIAPDERGDGAVGRHRRHGDVRAPRQVRPLRARRADSARRPDHRGRRRASRISAPTRSGSSASNCTSSARITSTKRGRRRAAGAERPRHEPEVRAPTASRSSTR